MHYYSLYMPLSLVRYQHERKLNVGEQQLRLFIPILSSFTPCCFGIWKPYEAIH